MLLSKNISKNKALEYRILNVETGEVLTLTVQEILEEINRDRSSDWSSYDESDWIEGLEQFTEYTYLGEKE